LAEGHAEKLIPAGESAHSVIAVVPFHATAKLRHWDEIGQLRKDCASTVHGGAVWLDDAPMTKTTLPRQIDFEGECEESPAFIESKRGLAISSTGQY
jgi:hypothetical protein